MFYFNNTTVLQARVLLKTHLIPFSSRTSCLSVLFVSYYDLLTKMAPFHTTCLLDVPFLSLNVYHLGLRRACMLLNDMFSNM